jgi:cellobiose phosphorylase
MASPLAPSIAPGRVVPAPAPDRWWHFLDPDPSAPAEGVFQATQTHRVDRLYFPLVNEGGMLSWTSPRLHGSPAAGNHAYLGLPLTAEDLPHTLAHRGFWLAGESHPPVALAGLDPEGLLAHVRDPLGPQIEAGPGWLTLTRHDPATGWRLRATLWCPADLRAAVELMHVEVTNLGTQAATVHPFAAVPLFGRSADNVRDHRHVTALLDRLSLVRHGVVACPTMSFDERGHTINTTRYAVLAFGADGQAPTDRWGVQSQFLGEGGSYAAPAAVWHLAHAPDPSTAALPGHEAIGGFRFAPLTLQPGERASYLLLSGITTEPRHIARWTQWASQPGAAERSLSETKTWWQRLTRRVAFLSGDRGLDQWLAWVGLQPTFRRLYGCSYLPQFDYGHGGRGWRDLWQDCLALLLSEPVCVRLTLLNNIGGVRVDGSNATIIAKDGAFVADRNNIPRTWMDHGVWPLSTTQLYIDQTGDLEVLLEEREYFRDLQLFRCRAQDPAWTEAYGFQLRTRGRRVYRGSVLEHFLIQHLTAFFNVGEHNLCLLEGADWNDGLDMARRRGESVAFSAFYAWNLERLAQLLDRLADRGVRRVPVIEELALLLDRLPGQRPVDYRSASAKRARLEQYLTAVARDISGRRINVPIAHLVGDLRDKHADLARRIREQEWLRVRGEGWFNGYYDDQGRRVEGLQQRRVRMTLTGQVFPLMGGLATEEQVDAVIQAVDRFLREPSGGIRLNTDFGSIQPALGRTFAFAYGEKENGAVFSHMAVMYAFALYARRRAEAGRRVWQALYRKATDQSSAKIFPGLPEYFNAQGRGMYAYLTGSASWMIYLLLTQVYGVRGHLGDLCLDPQLTREDFGGRDAVAVHAKFAGRPLIVRYHNLSRLTATDAHIAQVRIGERVLPITPRSEGGVLLRRALVTALPATPTTLDVTLSRRP